MSIIRARSLKKEGVTTKKQKALKNRTMEEVKKYLLDIGFD